ncbi:hypothetical protein Tco_1002907 [Tanacetum coccineum]|uniref:Xylulose kinase-1 n=1 Tax=Tanacetum coccineum TaxID=301880 RepID=A0ABQ5F8P5_9ASTR
MTTLQFANTHNLVAFLSKPAESEGFEQIVDFLNANPIRYALTINPIIYTSCIEQFWAIVKAKTVNREVQLQALVDGKKIIITESIVRRDLQLEDAEGIDCLPNATIFEQLTLMGYEKVLQKLTFYKAFFSPQWKFLIHIVLQCLSAKTAAWNEFSSTMASAIICLATNQKFNFLKYIFESMVKNLEKGFSGRETPLFQTMVVQHQEKMDEAVNEVMDDSLERAATTATSLDAEQDKGNIDKTQSKETLNEPSSLRTSLGSGPRCQETMGDTIAQTRPENVSKHSNDPLLARVLDLENTKTTQAQEITSLKLRVKKLENKGGSRTHKLKRLLKVGRSARMVSSDDASLGDQEDASKQGRKIDDIDKDAEITLIDETQGRYGDDLMFDTCVLDDEEVFAGQDMDEKDINVAEKEVSTANPVTTAGEVVTTASPTETTTANDLTLDQTLIEIKSVKYKVKGVVIGEQSESTTRTRPQRLPSKDKAQMQAELEEEDMLVRQREEEANIVSWDNVQAMIDAKLSNAIRAKEKRNKPPTKAQKRNTMATYLKNMVGYKHNQLKNKIFDDIQKLFDKAMKRVNIFVDMDIELVEGREVRAEAEIAQESSSKRAGTELEQEKEVAIDAILLATKPPSIVDYKILKEGKKTYYQIIRADESSKIYLVFSHMLKSFDREDLETLWKLVKAKHGSTRPEEGYERVLWRDLKTIFDPHVDDQVWRNQQDYRVLDWNIYDSCGVHSLRMQHMHIHMLVEKRYPLTPAIITNMLNKKLQCDHFNEMERIVGIKRLHDDLEVTTAKLMLLDKDRRKDKD